MHKLIKYYRLANVLSFDVVAGAVINSIFFSKIFNVEIRINGIISLGLSVWIIYTIDHLLDTYNIQHQASTARHRFHQQNKKNLIVMLVLSFIIVIPQLFFIRKPVLIGGVVLSFIIAIYFLLLRRLKYMKELFGAFLYAAGVLLVPLSLKFEYLSSPQLILMIQFFITALLNLLLFSWFDREQDCLDHRDSFATIFGARQTKKIVLILFIMNGILSICMLFVYTDFIFASAIILTMNLVLISIYGYNNYFRINDRYRIIGDTVFMIPLFYILLVP